MLVFPVSRRVPRRDLAELHVVQRVQEDQSQGISIHFIAKVYIYIVYIMLRPDYNNRVSQKLSYLVV